MRKFLFLTLALFIVLAALLAVPSKSEAGNRVLIVNGRAVVVQDFRRSAVVIQDRGFFQRQAVIVNSPFRQAVIVSPRRSAVIVPQRRSSVVIRRGLFGRQRIIVR